MNCGRFCVFLETESVRACLFFWLFAVFGLEVGCRELGVGRGEGCGVAF